MSAARPPAHCAVCGADIPPTARACPECGADERTGWREPSIYDGLDLPEEAYEDQERDHDPSSPSRSKARFWWVVALVMLAIVVVLVMLNRFWIAP